MSETNQVTFDGEFFTAALAASWVDLMAKHPEYYQSQDDYEECEALENITNVQLRGMKLFEVDNFGGEGKGDYAYTVWAVVPADSTPKRKADLSVAEAVVYLRMEGYYSSYNGTDWDYDSITTVKPVIVPKTIWAR